MARICNVEITKGKFKGRTGYVIEDGYDPTLKKAVYLSDDIEVTVDYDGIKYLDDDIAIERES